LVTTTMEGFSNYKTIEELHASLDRDTFWRVHRSYLVNINKIREVMPWFKSSYQLRMDDKKQTEIPVSRVQTKRLRELLKLYPMVPCTPPFKAPITGPAVWKGSDFSSPSDYWYYLSSETIAELDRALRRIRETGKPL